MGKGYSSNYYIITSGHMAKEQCGNKLFDMQMPLNDHGRIAGYGQGPDAGLAIIMSGC
jgi:hypothetical protein